MSPAWTGRVVRRRFRPAAATADREMPGLVAAWHTVSCVCLKCLRADEQFLAPERSGWRRLSVDFTR